MHQNLVYGNWIRKKILVSLGVGALGAGLLIFLPFGEFYRIVMTGLCAALLISFMIPFYSYLLFSQKIGGMQEKIFNLVINKMEFQSKCNILDIGTGNGVLAVFLAERFAESQVFAIDFWGRDWEYSKSVCEKNALTAGVKERIRFQKGDAASLQFADASFDGVTSNLTFHEVKSAKEKTEVVKEALRVLKPGGQFSFVDYFYQANYYGDPRELIKSLEEIGLSHFELHPLGDEINLPFLLKHPKSLGKAGILFGRK